MAWFTTQHNVGGSTTHILDIGYNLMIVLCLLMMVFLFMISPEV